MSSSPCSFSFVVVVSGGHVEENESVLYPVELFSGFDTNATVQLCIELIYAKRD